MDIFLEALHLFVIFFNLLGWIWPRTRLAHRWLLSLTAFCWIVVGAALDSIGFCPLTEWHWKVKEARGVSDLPASYIDYLLQHADIYVAPATIDRGVALTFAFICLVTLYIAWRDVRKNNL